MTTLKPQCFKIVSYRRKPTLKGDTFKVSNYDQQSRDEQTVAVVVELQNDATIFFSDLFKYCPVNTFFFFF